MKLRIELTDQQAAILMRAVDLHGRLCMGQLDQLRHLVLRVGKSNEKIVYDYDRIDYCIEELKSALFPNLQRNSYYGIHSEEVDEDSKVGYDMIQVIRNKIAWKKSPSGGITVNFHEPFKTSDYPLIKVEVIDED